MSNKITKVEQIYDNLKEKMNQLNIDFEKNLYTLANNTYKDWSNLVTTKRDKCINNIQENIKKIWVHLKQT